MPLLITTPRPANFVNRIADIEWIVVASELEALLLEYNLISQHKPKYNVRWKDDKKYPYIKVHWSDPFPKVTVTRRMEMENDGARYFGPYTSVWSVHQSLDTLRKVFPYLTCDRVITGQDKTCLPVLRHQIVYCAVHWSSKPNRVPHNDRGPVPLLAGAYQAGRGTAAERDGVGVQRNAL